MSNKSSALEQVTSATLSAVARPEPVRPTGIRPKMSAAATHAADIHAAHISAADTPVFVAA